MAEIIVLARDSPTHHLAWADPRGLPTTVPKVSTGFITQAILVKFYKNAV